MAYPAGYWAELVRSSTGSSLTPSSNGEFVWLRTSDGEPLEQEVEFVGVWFAVAGDTEEPDLLERRISQVIFSHRFRKTGEAWIPDATGTGTITASSPFNTQGIWRFFEQPIPNVAPAFASPTGPAITGIAGTVIPNVCLLYTSPSPRDS